ncbi:hypothetical protein [Nocardia sp. NPDC059154]|uniref:hypothetical protein n=1 Tax=Nocardia sp. NPDC059154 TaxID=3346744 RepID=UPI0036C10C71
MRLHPRPGSARAALDNALCEVTEHLGIDLPAFLAHGAIGPATTSLRGMTGQEPTRLSASASAAVGVVLE